MGFCGALPGAQEDQAMLEFTWFHEGKQARLAVAALFLLAAPLSAQPDSRSTLVPSAGVAVMAGDPRQLTIISGIILRGREASGTQFLPGNTQLETALKPSDVLPWANGAVMKAARSCRGTNLRPEAYLNGNRIAGGIESLDSLIPMRDVLAIEVYPDRMFIPTAYMTTTVCAVFAVWTR
jgi:hypothetical protein